MNKTLTLITVAILVSGCSSTDYALTTEERHQAAKTKYYENLNQGGVIARAEVEAKTERVPVER